jgi:hypothetical protein
LRLLIGEEPFDASGEVFSAAAIEFLERVLKGVSGLQEYVLIVVANVPKIVGEEPFQYLHVRLVNGHPIRCETCAFDVEFTVRSAVLDEAVRELLPLKFTHLADIPVPFMLGEAVQLINKLPFGSRHHSRRPSAPRWHLGIIC